MQAGSYELLVEPIGRTMFDQIFELKIGDHSEHFWAVFEGLVYAFNEFLFAIFIRDDPDGDREHLMLFLFDASTQIVVIAFAFLQYYRQRFGVQINLDEPAVFIFTVLSNSEEVRLQLLVVTVFSVWTPALGFPLHVREREVFIFAADFYQLNVAFGNRECVPDVYIRGFQITMAATRFINVVPEIQKPLASFSKEPNI